ncbi:hypothetical protein PUN28_007653 [Cardiocondyla obscurior]|uniref:Uncharacterized protein n=1 Tax=Cardiocondyla obscurior TaxID=286306 RepID=A0AAW2G7E2_9HYME
MARSRMLLLTAATSVVPEVEPRRRRPFEGSPSPERSFRAIRVVGTSDGVARRLLRPGGGGGGDAGGGGGFLSRAPFGKKTSLACDIYSCANAGCAAKCILSLFGISKRESLINCRDSRNSFAEGET